ncbi:hypothetical protein [Deinococcus pimensis]|uniref:hypothetical protein n=1 Tax=Deinococcus pimensis TaxID=309888 RepID=UPI0004806BA0|nr:hypothetical protein [Deinococcus pimensis]
MTRTTEGLELVARDAEAGADVGTTLEALRSFVRNGSSEEILDVLHTWGDSSSAVRRRLAAALPALLAVSPKVDMNVALIGHLAALPAGDAHATRLVHLLVSSHEPDRFRDLYDFLGGDDLAVPVLGLVLHTFVMYGWDARRHLDAVNLARVLARRGHPLGPLPLALLDGEEALGDTPAAGARPAREESGDEENLVRPGEVLNALLDHAPGDARGALQRAAAWKTMTLLAGVPDGADAAELQVRRARWRLVPLHGGAVVSVTHPEGGGTREHRLGPETPS